MNSYNTYMNKSYESMIYMNSYTWFIWIHVQMNSYTYECKYLWIHIIIIWIHIIIIWIHIWIEYMNMWVYEFMYMNSNVNSCTWIQMKRFWIHIWIHNYMNSYMIIHCIQSELTNLISLTWIHDMNSLLKIGGIQYSELVLLNSVVKPYSSVKISTVLGEH